MWMKMTNNTSLQLQSVVLLKWIVWYHFTCYHTHIMILLLILRTPSATLFNRDKIHTPKEWLTQPSTTNSTILILQGWTIIANPTMSSSGSLWNYEEEKAFENAIAMHWIEEASNEQWEKIASAVPSKSMEEVKQHYQILVEDVSAIEAGHIPFPNYTSEETTSSNKDFHGSSKATSSDKRSNCNYSTGFSGLGHDSTTHSTGKGALSRSSEQERRKGIPWTEEEHRYFPNTFTITL